MAIYNYECFLNSYLLFMRNAQQRMYYFPRAFVSVEFSTHDFLANNHTKSTIYEEIMKKNIIQQINPRIEEQMEQLLNKVDHSKTLRYTNEKNG